MGGPPISEVPTANETAHVRLGWFMLSLAIFLSVLLFAHGSDWVGLDFSCFWGAATMALQGHADSAYSWPELHQLISNLKPPLSDARYPYDEMPVPFFNPPMFLLALAPFALLSFTYAFWIWSASKISCWLFIVYAIRPRASALLLAASAPSVLYDFWAGQSSLLAATLLGGALLTLDRNWLLSGLFLALLIYKPHYGTLIPFVLLATGRWKVFAAAIGAALTLMALTGLLLGWNVFEAFSAAAIYATTGFHLVGVVPWYKLQSVYGLFRWADFGYGQAMALHVATATAASLWTLTLWRRSIESTVKAAALLAATPLISPYFAIYDLPLIALALTFFMNSAADTALSFSRPRFYRIFTGVVRAGAYAFPFAHAPISPIICLAMIALIAVGLQQSCSLAEEPCQYSKG